MIRLSIPRLFCTVAAVALLPTAEVAAQPTIQPTQEQMVADLNSSLTRLGNNPRDVTALVDAGEAALALGDPRAATGFFARADEIESGNGRIKAGLGKAMVGMQKPEEALRLFDQASRLGYPERSMQRERALARDLTGDQAGAQRDYQAVLRESPDDAELIRQYALSLGISGQADAAEKQLEPLLYKSDRGAWRDRAFIMAMNGRVDEARDITNRTMPKALAEAIQPYMARFSGLTPAQKAAAVHFGIFPTGVQVAAAPPAPQPAPVQPAPVVSVEPAREGTAKAEKRREQEAKTARAEQDKAKQVAANQAAPDDSRRIGRRVEQRVGRKIADAPSVAEQQAKADEARQRQQELAARAPAPIEPAAVEPPSQRVQAPPPPSEPARVTANQPAPAAVSPQVQGPPAPERQAPQPAVQAPVQVAAAASAPPPAPAAPPPSPNPEATRTLADIIRELNVPDSERQATPGAVNLAEIAYLQGERRKAQQAAAEKAKRDAEAKAKKAEADAKAKAAAEEKARIAKNPSRNWVQVGTGRDLSALAFTMKGLRKKYADLATRDAWTAGWGRTNRLVVGPFPSFAKAKDFEAQLKKSGADAFAWQSDDGEEVTRQAK